MILHDHEIRRRKATSALIDMICQRWPAQAHLRDEGNRLKDLRKQYKAMGEGDARDRLSDAISASCERMIVLVDVLMEQMPEPKHTAP
jgi:hypothetical protein